MSLWRPLNILRFKTFRPPRVLIRCLKPCTRARRRLRGWYVRFGIGNNSVQENYTHSRKRVSIWWHSDLPRVSMNVASSDSLPAATRSGHTPFSIDLLGLLAHTHLISLPGACRRFKQSDATRGQ